MTISHHPESSLYLIHWSSVYQSSTIEIVRVDRYTGKITEVKVAVYGGSCDFTPLVGEDWLQVRERYFAHHSCDDCVEGRDHHTTNACYVSVKTYCLD